MVRRGGMDWEVRQQGRTGREAREKRVVTGSPRGVSSIYNSFIVNMLQYIRDSRVGDRVPVSCDNVRYHTISSRRHLGASPVPEADGEFPARIAPHERQS